MTNVAPTGDITTREHVKNVVKAMQEVVDDSRRCLEARTPDEIVRIRERTRQHLDVLDGIVARLQ
jgi:hypothetical protein